MICSNGIHHVEVYIIICGKLKAAADYLFCVPQLVGGVKCAVAGKDFCLYISFKFWMYPVHNKKADQVARQVLFKNIDFV